ncbi:MAG: hypothetical protein RJQ04_01035 [Longimicrobiales bacterium]
MHRFFRGGLAVLGATVLSGCYTYVPVENPAPMTPVRITVPITNAVQNPNRAPETYTMEGIVVSAGDSLIMSTESRTEMGAFREVVRVDTVRVATRSLTGLDEKVFSTQRSIGLGVLVAGGTAALVSGILSITTGSDGGEPGGPSTENQIRIDPIFRSLLQALFR